MASSVSVPMTGMQRRKLRRLLVEAWRSVPLYRQLYEPLGLSEKDMADPAILSRLPVLSKDQMLAVPPDERVSRRFDVSRLARETTTGSTGQPFALYIDPHYRALRNMRFLRGLMAAGYRPWHRMLLLTDRYTGSTRRLNQHYQSVERPTGELVDAYQRTRPDVLYGFTTPLRLLAESLSGSGRDVHRPRLVVSTAEMLDPLTRTALQRTFQAPVFDFYGMTEMGLVAWQRPGFDGYIMSSSGVLTEFVPDDRCRRRYRMFMTNLDLRASPIIRFDSGDLAHVEQVDGKPRVMAFEGRQIDAIVRRDGSELSPYRITDALRDVPGVRRFKVTQHEFDRLSINLEVDATARKLAVAKIRSIFNQMLGDGVEVQFDFSDNLLPQGTRKFRPVASLVVRP